MAVKVMIFSSVHPYDDSRIFHKQAVSLVNAGYEVEMHAVSDFSERMEQGVRVVGVRRVNRKWKRLLLGWELYQRARHSDADIFHFHDPELLPWGALLYYCTRKPVIYDVHEDLPKQIYTKPWIPRLFRGITSRVVKILEKGFARRISAVIAATESIAAAFDGTARCTTVIKNYPLPMYVPAIEDRDVMANRILYIGGISYLRGYREMIAMMDHIPSEYQAELHLIGSLQHISKEDQDTESLREKNIFLHGRIPFADIKGWLSKGRVGLVCLHPIENYRESLPIKMFEYMAAGLPLVATDFPLWKEIVEGSGCGYTVDALSPEKIAEKVIRILEDRKQYQEMSEKGMQAFRETYNWHVEEEKLLMLYRYIQSREHA